MTSQPLRRGRARQPVKYALIAGLIAVASFVILEATGTVLTGSYSGISGKFGAGPAQTSPASATLR